MTSADRKAQLMRRASQASVSVALLLILLKGYTYLISDSLAMLGSLLDSALDGLASMVNLLAIRQATTPPDSDHRFGHEKAEPLAGLGQAAFILGSAVFLTIEAVQHLLHASPLQNEEIGILVSLVSILLILALLLFQRSVIRRTGSLLVGADALHYKSDLLTNIAVIFSLAGAARWNLPAIDAAMGLAIAFVIGHSAVALFRQAYDQLMDREAPASTRAEIKTLALRHGDVRAVHDIRTRMAGTRMFVQLHLELDPMIPLLRAHKISDEVEAAIINAFPGAEVIIHEDPAGHEMEPEAAHAKS
jgi:ferrous-iron efflux pump FieF